MPEEYRIPEVNAPDSLFLAVQLEQVKGWRNRKCRLHHSGGRIRRAGGLWSGALKQGYAVLLAMILCLTGCATGTEPEVTAAEPSANHC